MKSFFSFQTDKKNLKKNSLSHSNFDKFEDEKIIIKVKEPEVEMSIINRLSKPKFWVSNNDFDSVMQKIYKRVSRKALENF